MDQVTATGVAQARVAGPATGTRQPPATRADFAAELARAALAATSLTVAFRAPPEVSSAPLPPADAVSPKR
ncbi:hypothetical protein [Roseivivax isoporae]|uniref:hypothetical protein n=1 Tax=Roseivivax isoporae TaxID=591206 RepID=UPI0004B9936D|nr:hypothetical protein [Roseivivax isoporae]